MDETWTIHGQLASSLAAQRLRHALSHKRCAARSISVHERPWHINTLSAKDGDLRLSASNACLPRTEISVFVTECVFFTSTCHKLHMFTLHDVLYS